MSNALAITADEILKSQRTEEGVRFEKTLKKLRNLLSSKAPADRKMVRKLHEQILRVKEVGASSVHANQFLGNLSLQYANDEYIGTRLMPFVPVDKRSGLYAIYPKKERLAFPDDALTARGKANEISESRTYATYSVNDYGLQDFVKFETIANQDAPFNEMLDANQAVSEGIAFKREVRCATELTKGANYSGNTAALAGADQWDNPNSNPISKIQDALAAMWMGRGNTKRVMFSDLFTYNALARHPMIRELFKYTANGLASRQQIAAYFECDDYLVGAARSDTANEGQAASYSRIWGKVWGCVRVAQSPSLRTAMFGSTVHLTEDPVVTTWIDPALGKRGGYYIKEAVSEQPLVVAGDTGFLYTTTVA